MSFSNSTSFSAIDVPLVDASGADIVVAIVKATFEVDAAGRCHLADDAAEVRVGDVLHDETNPRSSLRYPSDVCPAKRGTDVIVVGEAVARKRVEVMDVVVKVRDVSAPLRVHGERVYFRGLGRVQIGPAAPFETKPITYERAYGGMSADLGVVEERNPSGVGVARRTDDLVGMPAPQIEHPARPYTSASDKHPPEGYGALSSHWSPRKEFIGTCDAAWRATRMPLLPLDFDVRYHNVAHPSLQFEQPIVTGDEIAVLGMSREGLFRFAVPAFPVVMRGVFDVAGKIRIRPVIDTIVIEPGRGRFELVARASFLLGRGQNVLREVRVEIESESDDG